MPHMVVVGSANMDLVMEAPRMPVLGETVSGGRFSTASGGKGANQAVACARLGASVTLVGCVGDDPFGGTLRETLAREGVETALRVVRGVSTGVASIFVVGGDNGILVAPGANGHVAPEDVRGAAAHFAGAAGALFQREIPDDAVLAGLALARDRGVRTVFNPAPWGDGVPEAFVREAFPLVDVFVPNRLELAQFAGTEDPAAGAARAFGAGVGAVVVTAGSSGAYCFAAPGDPGAHVEAPAVRSVDSTGAGDAFVGALAVALGEGRSLGDAVAFAVCAGALACTRLGAQPGLPDRGAVEALARGRKERGR